MDNLKRGEVGLQKLPWSTHCRTREGVSLPLLSSVSLPGFVFSAGLPLKRVSPNPDQDLWSGGCERVWPQREQGLLLLAPHLGQGLPSELLLQPCPSPGPPGLGGGLTSAFRDELTLWMPGRWCVRAVQLQYEF